MFFGTCLNNKSGCATVCLKGETKTICGGKTDRRVGYVLF